jgi:hypothetical protein
MNLFKSALKLNQRQVRQGKRSSVRTLTNILLALFCFWVAILSLLNHHSDHDLPSDLISQTPQIPTKLDERLHTYDQNDNGNNERQPKASHPGSITTDSAAAAAYDDDDDDIYDFARPTIAYAISFIECPSKEVESKLMDAIRVLRHSIHNISIRNPNSNSKYDYKMYAIVRAKICPSLFEYLAFDEIIYRNEPLEKSRIHDEHVKTYIGVNGVYGISEMTKLHAYNLTEEIVVHTDVDFAFFKPMDHLFDAMHFPHTSKEGQLARKQLQLELERPDDQLPDQIQAMFTRDWPRVAPGKGWKPGFQGGFFIVRKDPSVITDMVEELYKTAYVKGYNVNNGWAGKSYGDHIFGAMTVQGFFAYFYDIIRPNTGVELNQCLYNHMAMNVLYTVGGPFFRGGKGRGGGCRNEQETCQQCFEIDVHNIYNSHYTACKKPWSCTTKGESETKPSDPLIDTANTNLKHCMKLHEKWHQLRADLESQWYTLTTDESILEGSLGDYRRDLFHGHCKNESDYLLMSGSSESVERFNRLYQTKNA